MLAERLVGVSGTGTVRAAMRDQWVRGGPRSWLPTAWACPGITEVPGVTGVAVAEHLVLAKGLGSGEAVLVRQKGDPLTDAPVLLPRLAGVRSPEGVTFPDLAL